MIVVDSHNIQPVVLSTEETMLTRHRLSKKDRLNASVINLRDPSVRAERQEINAGRACP